MDISIPDPSEDLQFEGECRWCGDHKGKRYCVGCGGLGQTKRNRKMVACETCGGTGLVTCQSCGGTGICLTSAGERLIEFLRKRGISI